jgi:hypothetical protein
MVVEASSFRASGIAELEAIFQENMQNLRTLLALEQQLVGASRRERASCAVKFASSYYNHPQSRRCSCKAIV